MPASTRSGPCTAAIPTPVPTAAQSRPAMVPLAGASRRAIGWIAKPAENASAVIRPAKPADSVLALVTSSGSTTIAVDTEPNTSGAAGATATQKRQVPIAAGEQPP